MSRAGDPIDAVDLVVVGGGITGAGIARDAALRGLRVALFEKGDYGSGTSSKSSKLIHGGLRYLRQGEIGLVFESVSERAVQSKLAPHLVQPMPFLVPIYKQNRPGLEIVNIGLWIYDTLAMFRAPRLHKTFRGAKARALEPALTSENLTGIIEYYDYMTDDARLVLENILDARAHDAACCSYTEVVGLEREPAGEPAAPPASADDAGPDGPNGKHGPNDKPAGRITAVRVRDVLTGAEHVVRTRMVVIAAGPWTDELSHKLGIDTGRKLLRCTKGVHLVFPREKLPLERSVTLMSPVDGRVMFAIPWRDRTVIGTTDTDFDGKADEVYADPDDARYLCDSANRYFPDANLQPEDVIATWAGLRPLIQDPDAESESAVSREHEIFVRDDGILIIAGGKLTTYRLMAKAAVKRAVQWLRKHDRDAMAERRSAKPGTKKRPLPGAQGLDQRTLAGVDALGRALASARGLDEDVARHLARVYGTRAALLADMIEADPTLGAKMQPDLPHVWAEVAFAAHHDLARTIDDVLARRVPLLLIARDQGLGAVERVGDIMAGVHGWDAAERTRQIERYRGIVADSRRFRA